jgi:hypothetical protein
LGLAASLALGGLRAALWAMENGRWLLASPHSSDVPQR